jgi:hypothetical protein
LISVAFTVEPNSAIPPLGHYRRVLRWMKWHPLWNCSSMS